MRTNDQILIESAYRSVCEMAFGVAGQGESQEHISRDQLIDVIGQAEAERPGVTFIGITQVTKENTKKPVADPSTPSRGQAPIYPVFELPGLLKPKTYFAKVSQIGGHIGHDYEGNVQKATGDTSFTSGGFKSGMTRTGDSKAVVEKQDGYYLYYKPTRIAKSFDPVIVHQDSAGGFQSIDRQTVSQWKSPPRPSPGGVVVRTVSFNSIVAISINGKQYIIDDLDPVRAAIYKVSGAPMSAPEQPGGDEETPEPHVETPPENPADEAMTEM